MKSAKKLLALVFVIAICMSAFALPSYAVQIYKDKEYWYGYTDELSTKLDPSPSMTLDSSCSKYRNYAWDEIPWKYKNGEVKNSNGVTSLGTYPTRAGVILVTSSSLSSGLVGHAAMVINADEIIHAVSDGVVVSKNNWNTSRHSNCVGKLDETEYPKGSKEFVAVTVKKTTAIEDRDAVIYCYLQLDKPYNKVYPNMETREKFYCSQLIWAAYYDFHGIDLDRDDYPIKAVGPYEFVPTYGNESEYLTNVVYAQNWWGRPLLG